MIKLGITGGSNSVNGRLLILLTACQHSKVTGEQFLEIVTRVRCRCCWDNIITQARMVTLPKTVVLIFCLSLVEVYNYVNQYSKIRMTKYHSCAM